MLWRLAADDFLDAVQQNAASNSLQSVAIGRLARTHPRLAAEPVAAAPTAES